MELKDKVLFDPGYAPLVMDSIGQVGCVYYMFNAIKDVKIKRVNFLGISIKLERHLKTNIAFYLGCLMWASYIKQFDCDIEGNQLLGEKCSEDEYTSEIKFLIDFIKIQYPRDYKYYKNKNYEPDKRYLPILEAYLEFLILNKGFVNCSMTKQIVLPNKIKKQDEKTLKVIHEAIQKALENKNIEMLLDCYDLLF